ncbi:MAG: HPr family phosphocarrier protein [Endomicrobium sp.]|jgi:phosphocarrier protein|nr:HPr family phosphocarrier protein [Endomicrobium sp.]
MKKKIIKVKNKMGLHARPSSLLVRVVSQYTSTHVTILKDNFKVNGKSIMGVMALAASYDSVLCFIVDGPEEDDMLDSIDKLFKSQFNESK